jgi:hypothetical protein
MIPDIAANLPPKSSTPSLAGARPTPGGTRDPRPWHPAPSLRVPLGTRRRVPGTIPGATLTVTSLSLPLLASEEAHP